MDRRHFIGSLIAAGSLALLDKAKASPIVKLAENSALPPKTSRRKFDEEFAVLISDLHTKPGGYQPEYLRKTVAEILSMKPLPANVVALGDLAYLTGQPSEYSLLKEIISPIEEAGIRLTLAMGNHDRREEFAEAFPEHAARTLLKGRYVYIVETPNADIIVLDSLQQGDDKSTWITPGAVNDEQKEWLRSTLADYSKPVFVSSHHPLKETGVGKILLESPTCCGYIFGHDHRWKTDWIHRDYSEKRVIRTMCMPSTGHWGDIGLVKLKLGKDRAVAELDEKEFFFPSPAKDPSAMPETWKAICEDNKGSRCIFPYRQD